MLKFRGFALSFALAVLAAAPGANAATQLSAGVTKSCGEDTCFTNGKSYSQTFSASDFRGAVDISALALQRGILGVLQTNMVKVSFQLADGTGLGEWGSYVIAVLNGDVVTLRGGPFTWDTTMGDLVLKLDLVLPNKGGLGGGGGLGAFGGGGAFGLGQINTLPIDDPPPLANLGVISQLVGSTAEATLLAVPEPSTWAMLLAGFGGAGAMLRRQRCVARNQG